LVEDIVDESISLFRANCFFRNFEIKGTADRTLIYAILFISDCLQKLAKSPPPNRNEAWKALNSLSLQNFALPGEAGFPLSAMYQPPSNRSEAGKSL
jgi:actin related protein 2/3 complex subunit 3